MRAGGEPRGRGDNWAVPVGSWAPSPDVAERLWHPLNALPVTKLALPEAATGGPGPSFRAWRATGGLGSTLPGFPGQ